MIDPATAVTAAEQGLNRLQLKDNPDMAAARLTGHAGVPVLVSRLNAPGQSYYLIPWQDQRGITLIVQVDAQTGAMSSAAALATPLQNLTISPEQAQSIASDKLGAQAIDAPRLVWEACRETASAFQPLYQIPVAGGHVFVSMAGFAYRKLTPYIKGGRA